SQEDRRAVFRLVQQRQRCGIRDGTGRRSYPRQDYPGKRHGLPAPGLHAGRTARPFDLRASLSGDVSRIGVCNPESGDSAILPFRNRVPHAGWAIDTVRSELLALSISALHSAETFRGLASVTRSQATLQYCLFETEYLTRDGQLIPSEVNSKIIQLKGRPAVLAVARDITERKEAEAKLQASEGTFRRYVERSAAGFLRSTLGGEVLE